MMLMVEFAITTSIYENKPTDFSPIDLWGGQEIGLILGHGYKKSEICKVYLPRYLYRLIILQLYIYTTIYPASFKALCHLLWI